MHSPSARPPDLLRIGDLEREINVNRRTIYRMIQRGQFPPPLRVGPRMSYWSRADVAEWRDELAAAPANTN